MKNKPYWDKVTEGCYLVYKWSKRWNRFICTHKYDNQRDAELTVGGQSAKSNYRR